MSPLRISDIHTATREGITEVSADLEGFKLWYRIPQEFTPVVPGDVFLAAGILVAMHDKVDLEIEAPCSPDLLDHVRGPLQDIFTTWHPELSRVDVRAPVCDPQSGQDVVASFFSGGVDGCHSFLRHKEEITHLVTVHGIDIQVDNDELWSQVHLANQEFADAFGKQLIPVQTNIRRWCHPRGVGWQCFQGSGLASIAHALGVRRMYIAATHTYSELFPWGSHPLTDRLWSSDAVTLIHDGGEAKRSDKLRLIGTQPEALHRLRVCWMDAGYNCGQCEKCLRTRITLRALGLATPTLPRLDSVGSVRSLTIWNESELTYVDDNLRLSQEVGDRELEAALRVCRRRYIQRNCLRQLDEAFLGGSIRRLKRMVRGKGTA